MPEISLIIAFYKNLPALELILLALEKQSFKNFEVLIAEDDNEPETTRFLTNTSSTFPIIHVHQKEDNGFRKNEMLNAALKKTSGEKIVFIDGDCIPHPHFLKTYSKHLSEKKIFFGRRVLLSKKNSEKILKSKNLKLLHFLSVLMSNNRNKKYAFYFPFLIPKIRQQGIWGCNWGITKKDILAINGFDEDYVTAGIGEDVDIEWRLLKSGNNLFSIKQEALVYHLFHTENYTNEIVAKNIALMQKKKSQGFIFCKNGIKKCSSIAKKM